MYDDYMEDVDLSVVKQEPCVEMSVDSYGLQSLASSIGVMQDNEDTFVKRNEIVHPEIKQGVNLSVVKQEPCDVDSYGLQSLASSIGVMQDNEDTFVEENEIEEVSHLELEQGFEDSEDFELKELQKESRKLKKIKNNLISQNISIFLHAKSCPNCKRSFNSPIVKKKAIHFKSCCNSKKRWVEERELVIMIEDLKFKFKSVIEKHKQDNIDYDSSDEVRKGLETKKIYHYFSTEKSNIGNKKDVNDVNDR